MSVREAETARRTSEEEATRKMQYFAFLAGAKLGHVMKFGENFAKFCEVGRWLGQVLTEVLKDQVLTLQGKIMNWLAGYELHVLRTD